METEEKCDLCGMSYEYLRTETWRSEDGEFTIPQCGVVFALVHGENQSEINICEVCLNKKRIESALTIDQAREAFYQFGLEFSRLQQFEKARAALVESLQIKEEADCLASLACVESNLGNRDKALELYRRALIMEPDHFIANENLRKLTSTDE